MECGRTIPEIIPTHYRVLPRLSLTVCSTDRFKVGSLQICALLPNTTDDQLRSACLLPVLRCGCEGYPTRESIHRRLDDLYAADCRMVNRSVGNVRCVGFASEFLESRVLPRGCTLLPDLIDLMARLLLCPALEQGQLVSRYWEQERRNLIDSIAALINHPASYAMSRFMRAFREGRDAISPLTIEQVEAIGQEELLSLLQFLRERAHFEVFYVGQTPPEQLISELQRCFAPLLAGVSDAPKVCPLRLAARPVPHRLNESCPAGQSHLILGYRTPVTIRDDAFYAMMLCNELLGGGSVSRLFTHVREQQSLCYSIGSEYSGDRGELLISCGIDRCQRQRAELAIVEQLSQLQAGAFAQRELEAAASMLCATYHQLPDNTRAITSFYTLRSLMCLDVSVEECRQAIQRVTREQVVQAANTLRQDTVYFLEGSDAERAEGEEEIEEVSADELIS